MADPSIVIELQRVTSGRTVRAEHLSSGEQGHVETQTTLDHGAVANTRSVWGREMESQEIGGPVGGERERERKRVRRLQ